MLSANSFSQTILIGDVCMKRLFKILPFCLALVFVFSFSAFAKNNLNQTSTVVNAQVNLVKELNIKNSNVPQKYSEKINLLKSKCGKSSSEWSKACIDAVIDLLIDVITGSDKKEVLKDLLSIMKNCGLMPLAEYPNKSKSVLNNTQANLIDTNKHLTLVTSTATS